MIDPSAITIVRSKRRTISLHVEPDARVVVKAPLRLPERYILQFISQNEDWIEKHIQKKQNNLPHMKKEYKEGEEFLYLGKTVKLTIGNFPQIDVNDDQLCFPKFLEFRLKKELTDWYIKMGREVITRRLEWYAKDMDASYTGLTFSDTKSRWGSCSHDNQLQFNWRLIMAPLLVINYVVVHELVHTIEKNHSRDFWSKVGHYNPSYKQQRTWLKDYGERLIV